MSTASCTPSISIHPDRNNIHPAMIGHLTFHELIGRVNQRLIFSFRRITNSKLLQKISMTRSNSVGAILISDDPILFEKGGVPWPGVVISQNEGQEVIKYAKSVNEPSASITFHETIIGKKHAPAVALYSSRGPSKNYDGLLKPDLMTPGTLEFAAYTLKQPSAMIGFASSLKREYNMVSGTSMACPHAVGVATLLKDVHPDWSPSAIRSAMMTTANPLDNTNGPEFPLFDRNSHSTLGLLALQRIFNLRKNEIVHHNNNTENSRKMIKMSGSKDIYMGFGKWYSYKQNWCNQSLPIDSGFMPNEDEIVAFFN